ncbi:hypothetical protein Q8A67_020173 [Cirrhinus molitorella]|uniref:Uncharacterized protein n=1 Tax=Cirrhinus molitorella TaxID=172907 RepID=A0AA88P8E1_9TELE|nr:hypothetical protein Q8A67_020173 [Cirrhinus molitorella]
MNISIITTMNVVNAVQLFILVWTFSAVCQADDDFSISCDDVTGSVGKEATFTCRILLQDTECCAEMYKFQYPNNSEICKEESLVNSCDHSNSFTCRYTPTRAMIEKFRFFLQAKCGRKKTEFSVNITDFSVSCDDVTGSAGKEVTFICSISLQDPDCCVTLYKFPNSEGYNDSANCKKVFPDKTCDRKNSIRCNYTPTTVKAAKFKFVVQTMCGVKSTEFTVNMTEPREPEIDNEPSGLTVDSKNQTRHDLNPRIESEPSPSTAITPVVGCFILIIIVIAIVIVIMKVIHNKKNFSTYCGFQKRMFLGLTHDEDNSNNPEDVI